jgi:hypothetical protein
MANIFETPLSKVTAEGYDATIEYAKSGGMMDLFVWLALIFLKAHLKDRDLRLNLDQRLGAGKLSDLHPWEDLHHLHCVARSFYTHCEIDTKVLGSVAILSAKADPDFEAFDFCDVSVAQTMLLRLGEVAFITVLNDSCAALNVLSGALGKLIAPLTPMQLRELTAKFATVNLNLVHRPTFSSQFKPKDGRYIISAQVPEKLQIGSASRSQFGEVVSVYRAEAVSRS